MPVIRSSRATAAFTLMDDNDDILDRRPFNVQASRALAMHGRRSQLCTALCVIRS